jgi:hypothetical protein
MPILKNKKLLILTIVIIVAGGFLTAVLQDKIIGVSAQLDPIMFVSPELGLAFGMSFPQEVRTAEFVVVGKNYHETIHYIITHKYKPFWPEPAECGQGFTYIEDAREYCQIHYNDFNCCYPNLCPYLTETIEENELDTPQHATVDPCQRDDQGYLVCGPDNTDYWLLTFNVPTIKGYVDQGFVGTPVDAAGDYGCDLKIEIIE